MASGLATVVGRETADNTREVVSQKTQANTIFHNIPVYVYRWRRLRRRRCGKIILPSVSTQRCSRYINAIHTRRIARQIHSPSLLPVAASPVAMPNSPETALCFFAVEEMVEVPPPDSSPPDVSVSVSGPAPADDAAGVFAVIWMARPACLAAFFALLLLPELLSAPPKEEAGGETFEAVVAVAPCLLDC